MQRLPSQPSVSSPAFPVHFSLPLLYMDAPHPGPSEWRGRQPAKKAPWLMAAIKIYRGIWAQGIHARLATVARGICYSIQLLLLRTHTHTLRKAPPRTHPHLSAVCTHREAYATVYTVWTQFGHVGLSTWQPGVGWFHIYIYVCIYIHISVCVSVIHNSLCRYKNEEGNCVQLLIIFDYTDIT